MADPLEIQKFYILTTYLAGSLKGPKSCAISFEILSRTHKVIAPKSKNKKNHPQKFPRTCSKSILR
jgi:hypothetical protein